MLTTQVIERPETLVDIAGSWDRLAEICGMPFCLSGWMLAWWHHAAPNRALLRAICVYDGEELVGAAAYSLVRAVTGVTIAEHVAAKASLRLEPIALPGAEREVAGAIAKALAEGDSPADVIAFHGIPAASIWPGLLREAWPGHEPWMHTDLTMPAPFMTLTGTYEGWFSARSRNFREQTRRRRRQLEKAGAVFRVSDPERLETDLKAFARLHRDRWAGRGGTSVLVAGVEEMLLEAGKTLLPSGNFHLWCIDVADKTISTQIFLTAGGQFTYWLGGFDEAWSSSQPSMQALVAAVEDAWARGEQRVDLGGGDQAYKYRLADEEERLEWTVLVPRGRRYPVARLHLAPRHLKRAVLQRTPDSLKSRVKAILGRPG